MEKEAKWLASLDPSIALHMTRYFPNWKYDLPATPKETVSGSCQQNCISVYVKPY